jgi:hypothetical protein
MTPKTLKAKPKAVQPAFILQDTKKYGTVSQQTELYTMLQSMPKEQVQGVQTLLRVMSSGACINGDNTIDASTGLRTTGGYRKSVHYLKAFLANQPTTVDL